jgi:hypothetical protein
VSESSEKLLRDLRSALLQCLPESEEGRKAMAGLRRAGLSVYLVLDDEGEGEPDAMPLMLAGDPESDALPVFRIDKADLRILRELGIDPTRTLRRRR